MNEQTAKQLAAQLFDLVGKVHEEAMKERNYSDMNGDEEARKRSLRLSTIRDLISNAADMMQFLDNERVFKSCARYAAENGEQAQKLF